MNDREPVTRSGSVWRWLPGVLISLSAIAFIAYFVDLNYFIEAIRAANYWLLLAVLAMAVIWLGVRAIVWRTLLRGRARWSDTFFTICEGYLLNNVLPFRLGELGRSFLLARKSGLDFMTVLPTVILERVIDLVFAALILLSAVPFVVGAEGAGQIAVVIAGGVLAGLIVLFILARNREQALALFARWTGRWPGVQQRGGAALASLFDGLAILTDLRLFLRVLFWMTLNWGLGILQFYVLVLAFFPQAQPLWSLFGLGAVAFGNAIPSLPGAVGTFEASLGGALTLLSGDQATALAAAVTAHLVNYLSSGVIGLLALSREGETLMGIYRQLRRPLRAVAAEVRDRPEE